MSTRGGRTGALGLLTSCLFLCAIIAVSLGIIADMDDAGSRGESRAPSYMDTADYTGSEKCGECHDVPWGGWGGTLHHAAFGPATVDSVVGDFAVDPVITVAEGVTVTLDLTSNASGFFMDLDGTGGSVHRVDHVQGSGSRLQAYLTTIGSSRYILPVAWATDPGLWIPFGEADWYDTATGAPKLPAKDKVWDLLCAACHATNVTVSHNATTGEYVATWSEAGVACERCHGPGSMHVRPPSGEDRRDYIQHTLDASLCGMCHSAGVPVGTVGGATPGYPLDASGRTIRPGDDLSDFMTLQSALHPDGETGSGQAQQYNDYLTSRHAHSLPTLLGAEGRQDYCLDCHSTDRRLAPADAKPTLATAEHDIECALCHDVHSTDQDRMLRVDRWETCVQCHRNGDRGVGSDPLPSMREMVEGKVPVAGLDGEPWMGGDVICTDCHMPPMARTAIEYDLASHNWHFISPKKSIDYGMPNSCTVACHHAGSPEGGLTAQEALDYVEGAKAAATAMIAKAEANLTVARARLDAGLDLGFPNATVVAQNTTYNELAFVLAFVKRDMSRVHNPPFYAKLLGHVADGSAAVSAALMPGTVRGRVLDGDGKAVAGAQVTLDGRTRFVTAADGSFAFDIAPGTYTFEVVQDGKVKKEFTATGVAAGTETDVGDVKYKADKDGPGPAAPLVAAAVALAAATALASRRRR